MRKIVLLVLLVFLSVIYANAQSIKGQIKDSGGAALVGASVQVKNSFETYISDLNGKFEIKGLKSGTYEILVSFVGYENLTKKIEFSGEDVEINLVLEEADNVTEEVVVSGLRAGRNTPVAYSEMDKEEITKNNLGKDIPYLLELMPSVTATSDGGTGVGYSQLSVRGTDLNRINVTVNGIPLNDAESHGVWWVDLPDLATSIENIQVQRGVGTSTNGPAAFGANINIQTNRVKKDAFGELASSYGTFNTYKTSIKAGTGLLNDHFAFDVRLSKIHSDGFIDRATTDMESFLASGSYSDKKTLVKFNVISGKENTYQAWNGVPKVRLDNDLDGMQRYADHWLYSQDEVDEMVASDSRTYNLYTYDNEVDDYTQSHYQVFVSRELMPELKLNLGFNYTKGKGYYEQYKADRDFEDYGFEPAVIGNDTAFSTDLIQRKWLDNDLYVVTYSLDYLKDNFKATLGGSWQDYYGRHYGEVIWAKYAGGSEIRDRWYSNIGDKQEFNIYGKFEYLFFNQFNVYVDLQYRTIDYEMEGPDDDLVDISQKHSYSFFNPKFGLSYNLSSNQNAYFTFGIANREPTRTDLKDRVEGDDPVHETLMDYELGYTISSQNAKLNVNLYYMDYKDQLVKTGRINNVGNPISVNMPESYRRGLEIAGGIRLFDQLDWQANVTFSQNKILDYTEYTDNWETWGQDENYIGETNISFSPEVIVGGQLAYQPFKGFEVALISKYVGEQYIDNSSAKDRMLDSYFVNNLRLNYHFATKWIKGIDLQFAVNNVFNEEYETNAWVYRYFWENEYHNMDGYFPQAGINVMGGVVLNF
jgi:iron complex outermembrane recepter protein